MISSKYLRIKCKQGKIHCEWDIKSLLSKEISLSSFHDINFRIDFTNKTLIAINLIHCSFINFYDVNKARIKFFGDNVLQLVKYFYQALNI